MLFARKSIISAKDYSVVGQVGGASVSVNGRFKYHASFIFFSLSITLSHTDPFNVLDLYAFVTNGYN